MMEYGEGLMGCLLPVTRHGTNKTMMIIHWQSVSGENRLEFRVRMPCHLLSHVF